MHVESFIPQDLCSEVFLCSVTIGPDIADVWGKCVNRTSAY